MISKAGKRNNGRVKIWPRVPHGNCSLIFALWRTSLRVDFGNEINTLISQSSQFS